MFVGDTGFPRVGSVVVIMSGRLKEATTTFGYFPESKTSNSPGAFKFR